MPVVDLNKRSSLENLLLDMYKKHKNNIPNETISNILVIAKHLNENPVFIQLDVKRKNNPTMAKIEVENIAVCKCVLKVTLNRHEIMYEDEKISKD